MKIKKLKLKKNNNNEYLDYYYFIPKNENIKCADGSSLESTIYNLKNKIDTLTNKTNDLIKSAPLVVTAEGTNLDIKDSAESRIKRFGIYGNSKQETKILPNEYTQVDYIESTSYAYNYNYINTGIFPTNNTSIEMSVNIPSDITHSYDRLFGSGTLLSVHLDGSNQNKARVLWNKTLSSNYSLIDVTFGIKNIIKQDKNVTYLNGEKILEFSNGNFKDDKELRLFSSLEDRGDRDGIFKLYYCKIWENDILKRNFIPCYRNSDNEIGLYDTVNNVFYTNQGTGTFIKGNDSSLPSPEYPSEVESCGDNINLFDKDNVKKINAYFDSTIHSNSANRIFWLKIDKNQNYTISKVKGSVFGVAFTEELPETGVSIYKTKYNNTGEVITTNSGSYDYLVCYYWSTSDVLTEQQVIDSIKIEKGSKATSYTPYNQGCINEVISNKNLFDKNTVIDGQYYNAYGGLVTSAEASGSDFIKVEVGQNYYVNKTISMVYFDENKQAVGILTKVFTGKFTPEYPYIKANVYTADKDTLQIEKGSTSTACIQHKSQTYTIPTQQPMRSVGDTRDTFIKKNNKIYEHHLIFRKIFDGTEGWTYTNSQFVLYGNGYLKMENGGKCICSHFPYAINTDSSIWIGNGAFILIQKPSITTLDDWKAWLSEQYNAGTPVYVDYILETPIDIECIEEQSQILDNVTQLQTYENITHIYSPDKIKPNMKIAYKKDINSIIRESGV